MIGVHRWKTRCLILMARCTYLWRTGSEYSHPGLDRSRNSGRRHSSTEGVLIFFFQAEDGIRDLTGLEFRRVLFRSVLKSIKKNSPSVPSLYPVGRSEKPSSPRKNACHESSCPAYTRTLIT